MRKINVIPYEEGISGSVIIIDDGVKPNTDTVFHTSINGDQTIDNDLLADEIWLFIITNIFDGVETIMVKGEDVDIVQGVIAALSSVVNDKKIKTSNDVCKTILMSYYCREKQYPPIFGKRI